MRIAILPILVFVASGCAGAQVAGTLAIPSPAVSQPPASPSVQATTNDSTPTAAAAIPSPDAVDARGTCFDVTDQCTLMDVATWRSIPFTPEVPCSGAGRNCQILENIYGPTNPGPWPLFVMVSGAMEGPDTADSYIDDFAKQLAGRGSVVMRANWRRVRSQGGGYPASLADIGCAIGVARDIGRRYGADPASVVLVGHSNGGWASSVVGLTGDAFTPTPGTCNETSGSLRPDAWAAMAPATDYATASFIGGDQNQMPDAWAAVSPSLLAADSAGTDQLPVTLIQGGKDNSSTVASTRELQSELIDAGIDSTLVEEPDADHPGILFTIESLDALMALAARSHG